MHALHWPRTLRNLPASFHSFGENSHSTFSRPQLPRHVRCSLQTLHHSCDGSFLRQTLGSNISCVCQLPQNLHCPRSPSHVKAFSQLLQYLFPSLRFHCGSENSPLNCLASQPEHMWEGMCLASIAAQSMASPRNTRSNKSDPSWLPWLNSSRSNGLKISKSSFLVTRVNAT